MDARARAHSGRPRRARPEAIERPAPRWLRRRPRRRRVGASGGEARGESGRPPHLQRRLARRHRVRRARQRGRDDYCRPRPAGRRTGAEVRHRGRGTRRGRAPADVSTAYEDYQEGWRRLRSGRTAQATVPLEKAPRAEPRKASIREALGIAYFRLRRWEDAEVEFRAVLEISPVNDYA